MNRFLHLNSQNTEDIFEIVVCHCNIIKFFVQKAMGVDGFGLRRLNGIWFPCHASITILSVASHGGVFIRTLGDSGHLPVMIKNLVNNFDCKSSGVECKFFFSRHNNQMSLVTVNNITSDVFWNSWMQPPPPLPLVPKPLPSNKPEDKPKSVTNLGAEKSHYNTASHATEETDFIPTLSPFQVHPRNRRLFEI